MMCIVVVHVVITGLERLRQEEHDFKASPAYVLDFSKQTTKRGTSTRKDVEGTEKLRHL